MQAFDWAGARGEKWRIHLSGMESTLLPIDEPLLRALAIDAPSRIADLACGGGGTTIEVAKHAPTGSIVHGFDVSPSLIELARRRTRSDERAIVFDVADVAMAAPDKPYERLVSRFGVMFFDDPRAAFANLLRWLAPGGRFAFAVWGPPSENPWTTSVRDAVARIVEIPPSEPEAPGPFRYADAAGSDRLLALLDHAGFAELDVREWRGALPIGGHVSPAEAARFALASFSSFAELLAKAGDAAQDDARRSVTALFSDHQRDGAVRMDACVRIVTGARP